MAASDSTISTNSWSCHKVSNFSGKAIIMNLMDLDVLRKLVAPVMNLGMVDIARLWCVTAELNQWEK